MDEIQTRLEGIERNLTWLKEHDIEADSLEAAKRIGLIKGDCTAIVSLLDDRKAHLTGEDDG